MLARFQEEIAAFMAGLPQELAAIKVEDFCESPKTYVPGMHIVVGEMTADQRRAFTLYFRAVDAAGEAQLRLGSAENDEEKEVASRAASKAIMRRDLLGYFFWDLLKADFGLHGRRVAVTRGFRVVVEEDPDLLPSLFDSPVAGAVVIGVRISERVADEPRPKKKGWWRSGR